MRALSIFALVVLSGCFQSIEESGSVSGSVLDSSTQRAFAATDQLGVFRGDLGPARAFDSEAEILFLDRGEANELEVWVPRDQGRFAMLQLIVPQRFEDFGPGVHELSLFDPAQGEPPEFDPSGFPAAAIVVGCSRDPGLPVVGPEEPALEWEEMANEAMIRVEQTPEGTVVGIQVGFSTADRVEALFRL